VTGTWLVRAVGVRAAEAPPRAVITIAVTDAPITAAAATRTATPVRKRISSSHAYSAARTAELAG
jgi:hypothetical protein